MMFLHWKIGKVKFWGCLSSSTQFWDINFAQGPKAPRIFKGNDVKKLFARGECIFDLSCLGQAVSDSASIVLNTSVLEKRYILTPIWASK